MEVCNYTNQPNFNGVHITKANVLKRMGQEVKNFVPTESHIVELDYNHAGDKKAVEELYRYWQGAEFMPMISSSTTTPNRRVFAITTQTGDYENIDSSKIMGIVDYKLGGKDIHLSFLQGKPEIINKDPREIKGVGKSLVLSTVDYLKSQGYKDLKVFSRPAEKPFYRNIFPNIKDKESTADDCANMIVEG